MKRRSLPVATGLCLLLLLAIVAVVPAPPRAAAADDPVQVLIESVTPANPDRKDVLRLTGRVANTGTTDLTLPGVELRISPLQLNSRAEIPQVLNGTTERIGDPLPQTAQPLGDTLVVGQQAKFDLQIPVKELPLDPALAGVYAVFVEFRSGGLALGQAGTVFPWFPPEAEIRPTNLAWVWPVVAEPAVAGDELVTDPALPSEFAGSGRLGRLLDVGEDYPVSWLIDTATWQVARQMADGYRVAGPDGPQPGDQTDAAGQFADRVQRLMNEGATTTSQFALADADALQRGGLSSFVVRSATLPEILSEQIARDGDTSAVFDAPSGTSDPAALETLVDSGVRQLLLRDTYFPPDPPTAYTPSGVTPITVGNTQVTGLLADRQLGRTLERPLATAADRSRAKQEFLADTALITLELPTETRSVIALPPELWDPEPNWLRRLVSALDRAPWLELVGLQDIARATPVPRLDLGYPETARRRELPQDYVTRIRDLDQQLDQLSRVVLDPTGYGESLSLALQRAGSSLWRADRVARTDFIDTIDRQIQEQKDKVRVVSSGTVTLAGESGVVPLTVANDLDQPVSVGVQLATDNPITLQYTPPEPIRIDAREKAGIEVPVRVVGSQPMTVRVLLTDRDGGLYDDRATIELRSTASSRIATWVVGVGGVALVILVTLNLVRRRKRSQDERRLAALPEESDDARV